MNIFIGSDHAGFEAKREVKEVLEQLACTYEDIGTFTEEAIDYPVIARKVCEKVLTAPHSFGILICGSGTGMAIAANKIKNIRASLCLDTYSAQMARKDTDCNVLCLRARNFDVHLYHGIIRTFLETPFSEEPRHKKRIGQLEKQEGNR